MTSTEIRHALINDLWREIIDTWKEIDMPEYVRGKLDLELDRYCSAGLDSESRISLRALSRQNDFLPMRESLHTDN